MGIFFHVEDTDFKLSYKSKYKNWIKAILSDEGFTLGNLNFIFTSNSYLLQINRRYLNHDYFTDVITFDYNDGLLVSGDIYISVDQVMINAQEFNTTFNNELARVIIHGVFHLLGHSDSTEKERNEMRAKENGALQSLEL